jgi:hypothetical protein
MSPRRCSSCGSEHYGRVPCGLTFIQRMRSVRVDQSNLEAPRGAYYDEDAVREQFGADARDKMLDATDGMGAARRDSEGRSWHMDRHSGEWQPLTPAQVKATYLSGPEVSDDVE